MARYEWRGWIVVDDQGAISEEEAREIADDTLAAVNKNADGARVFLDDNQEPNVEWTYDKEDDVWDRPCPECGAGPLDLKGHGAVCPNGHILEGE